MLGFIELSRGDPAAALGYLERAWEIRDSVRVLEPGHRLELADTLEALIAVGKLEEAEQKLVPWEERARALDRSWALAITARCRALILAARGDLAGAEAGFERALAEHARTQDPFQHARTLLAQGVTQRRAKQRGAARATLEQALASFERLGAPLWAEKARSELARIGGRAPSRGELTEAERRIAALVAEGRTNREVAAALFVTEHTVEGALTRVYRKLGVRSRAELAHRLGTRVAPGANCRGFQLSQRGARRQPSLCDIREQKEEAMDLHRRLVIAATGVAVFAAAAAAIALGSPGSGARASQASEQHPNQVLEWNQIFIETLIATNTANSSSQRLGASCTRPSSMPTTGSSAATRRSSSRTSTAAVSAWFHRERRAGQRSLPPRTRRWSACSPPGRHS